MPRWNTQEIVDDFNRWPDVEVERGDEDWGGDFDTTEIGLRPKGADDWLWIQGFDNENQVGLTDEQRDDHEIKCVVLLSDGCDGRGGVVSRDERVAGLGAIVRGYLEDKGFFIYNHWKELF